MRQLLAALQMRNLTREGVSITYIPLCAILDLAGEGAGVYIQSPAPQSCTMPPLTVTARANFSEQLLGAGVLLNTSQRNFTEYPQQPKVFCFQSADAEIELKRSERTQ